MQLAKEIYIVTNSFPSEEKFGLVQQMRRAAVSVPSNIAEGAARQGKKEFRNFLSVAQGSLSELDTQLELSLILGMLLKERYEQLDVKMLMVDKMLSSLIRNILKQIEEKKGC